MKGNTGDPYIDSAISAGKVIYYGGRLIHNHYKKQYEANKAHAKASGRVTGSKPFGSKPPPGRVTGSKPFPTNTQKSETPTRTESAPNNIRKAEVKTYKKKGVEIKKKGTVKISKHFKEMVVAATEATKHTGNGIYHARNYGTINVPTTGNLQSIGHSPGIVQATTLNGGVWEFTPDKIVSAASMLFNKAPAKVGNIAPTAVLYNTTCGSIWGSNPNAVTGYPAIPEAVITVKNSWSKFLIKNNTRMTYNIDVYEVAPKLVGTITNDAYNIPAGVTVANTSTALDPPAIWVKSCQEDYGQNVMIPYTSGSTTLSAAAVGSATSSVVPFTLGDRPTVHQAWNKLFKAEKTNIIIEPGQITEYFLQGPQNLTIKPSDHIKGDIFQDIQKYSRYPMFITNTELGADTTGMVGRVAEAVNTSGNTLLYEHQTYFDIKIPDMMGAGIVGNTTAGLLTSRHRSYCLPTWDSAFNTVNVTRVDSQAPGSIETITQALG